MIRTVSLFAATTIACGCANAESIQFQCAGLKGHSYYAAEGIVTSENGGWSEDAISNGEMVISMDLETGAVDYRYKDATQKWYSPLDEGGSVSLQSIDTDGSFQILASFPGSETIEVLSIGELAETTAKLVYTSSRNSSPFLNAKLMTADCTIH